MIAIFVTSQFGREPRIGNCDPPRMCDLLVLEMSLQTLLTAEESNPLEQTTISEML
jgi:hypothetical protein